MASVFERLPYRHLPVPELARLSCVHKAFHVAWQSLQGQDDGELYEPPSARDLTLAQQHGRLERAGAFGDVAVICSMLAAGVDEHGTPLLEARTDIDSRRRVDQALISAACNGHCEAAELLLAAGANVHENNDWPLRAASWRGHLAIVRLLLQHGANVHAKKDEALVSASMLGHTAIVGIILQHVTDTRRTPRHLRRRSAAVHAGWLDEAMNFASLEGHADIMQLLIQHGAAKPTWMEE
jgi:hypothetical protein